MIEQVINWWNSFDYDAQIAIAVSVIVLLFVLIGVFCCNIIPLIQNKNKTITQKFREGLIKK